MSALSVEAPTPFHSPRPSASRVVFLDALRLVAAMQMVQGHTLDAVLEQPARDGPGFLAWSFARGLTSSAFLLAAGLSFAVVSRSASFELGRPRRLRRALTLIALGYLLHAPVGLLAGESARTALAGFSVVDVLQCIGVGLLGLEALCRGVTRPRLRAAFALGACAALFLLAPHLNELEPTGLDRLWLNYATGRGGSLFPLSPWLGFMCAGYAAGAHIFRAGPDTGRWTQPRRLLGCTLASTALTFASWSIVGAGDLRLGLTFLLLKLSLVFLLAAALACLLVRAPHLGTWPTRLAGETLFLYVSHVLVLYGSGIGLKDRLGPRLSVGQSLGLAALLLVACSAAALGVRALGNALRARGASSKPGAWPSRKSPPAKK